jgi:hypothetical protein
MGDTMKYNELALAAACAGIGLVASNASAHHAFSAQYDSTKPATFTGVVTKVEWLNPHAYFFIDVTDEQTGKISSWACELTSPVGLMRQGWTRNSMKIGDVVIVDGILARDNTAAVNAQSVILTSTGQKLFGRSVNEERLSQEQQR